MRPEIRTYLSDILSAIEEIDSFFEGMIMEFVSFVGDRKTQRAVERNLSIIGEPQTVFIRLIARLTFQILEKLLPHEIESFMDMRMSRMKYCGLLLLTFFRS